MPAVRFGAAAGGSPRVPSIGAAFCAAGRAERNENAGAPWQKAPRNTDLYRDGRSRLEGGAKVAATRMLLHDNSCEPTWKSDPSEAGCGWCGCGQACSCCTRQEPRAADPPGGDPPVAPQPADISVVAAAGEAAANPAPAAEGAASAPAPVAPAVPAASAGKVDDLLNLDIDQLSKVRVSTTAQATNLNAPRARSVPATIDFHRRGDDRRACPGGAERQHAEDLGHQPRSAGPRLSFRRAQRQRQRHERGEDPPRYRLGVQPDRSGHCFGPDGDRRAVHVAVRAGLRLSGGGSALRRRATPTAPRPTAARPWSTARTARRSTTATTCWPAARIGA